MARAGLGSGWECLFANDFDEKKCVAYSMNWGDEELLLKDVGEVSSSEIPGKANLAWASSPCQDVSLAGAGAGLAGARSSTFWSFVDVLCALKEEKRAPTIVAFENVTGLITSHGGKDFEAVCSALSDGYRIGGLVVDAVRFVPQSRPRFFIIAIRDDCPLPQELILESPRSTWHTKNLVSAVERLSIIQKEKWVWWKLPDTPNRNTDLTSIIEQNPVGVKWHTHRETQKLISLMAPLHLERLDNAKNTNGVTVGTLYKRVRDTSQGKQQRAEVRFDGVAGCLRTPAGGSSRQTILIVEDSKVKSRLLSPREAARLMGLPETYSLPEKYNDAYHLIGDGVAVPVVKFLSDNIFLPVLENQNLSNVKAA